MPTTMDFARGRAEDSVDTLERVAVPGLDAVSVDSQIGPMVGSYHPVEQPVAFTNPDGG